LIEKERFPLLVQEGWIPAWVDKWEGKQEDGVVKKSVISTLCPIVLGGYS